MTTPPEISAQAAQIGKNLSQTNGVGLAGINLQSATGGLKPPSVGGLSLKSMSVLGK